MDASEIKRLRKSLKLNQTDFASLINSSLRTVQNYEKGNTRPTAEVLLELQKLNNNMQEDAYNDEINEPSTKYDVNISLPNIKDGGVPYYDVDFHGGFDFVFNDQTIQPSFNIDYAPYNDCDAWINVTGKSMSPFISHGDIAALKKLNDWRSFIPFGEIYAVLTNEHKTIKIVSQGKDENHLKLIPYNDSKEFVAQEIPKDLIQQMYRVKGSIKKFF